MDEGVRSLLEERFGALGRSVIGMAQAIPVPGCFGNRKIVPLVVTVITIRTPVITIRTPVLVDRRTAL